MVSHDCLKVKRKTAQKGERHIEERTIKQTGKSKTM